MAYLSSNAMKIENKNVYPSNNDIKLIKVIILIILKKSAWRKLS